MRLTLLAILVIVATASTAQAQLPSHRAAYAPKKTTVRYQTTTSSMSHVESTIAAHGFVSGGYGDGADGCPCGHPPRTGRNCCPSIFPDVLDNIFDPLICLVPTRAHCCSYPKVNTCNYKPSTYSACGCKQPFLNGIFACKKSCCQSRASGCSSCSTPAAGCSSCTSKGSSDSEVITSPMPESPFKDDPAADAPAVQGATKKKVVAPKTASNRQNNWYKTSTPTPVSRMNSLNAPGTIAVGNATPISIRE